MIRVLLADDQPLVRIGFRMILEAEPGMQVIGEAGDGADAVLQSSKLHPDVVVMDIQMPIQDGLSATSRITAAGDARVLILTTFHLDQHVVGALRAGASGFLLKDADADKLIEAIRVVHAGNAIVDPAVTRRLLDRFAHRLPQSGADRDRADARRARLDGLTQREIEVLALVARGLSNAEIAAELVLTEATIKTHVHHVLTKLGARDRVQLVVLAYDSGLVGPPPPS